MTVPTVSHCVAIQSSRSPVGQALMDYEKISNQMEHGSDPQTK